MIGKQCRYEPKDHDTHRRTLTCGVEKELCVNCWEAHHGVRKKRI